MSHWQSVQRCMLGSRQLGPETHGVAVCTATSPPAATTPPHRPRNPRGWTTPSLPLTHTYIPPPARYHVHEWSPCHHFLVLSFWPPLSSFYYPDSLTACVVILLSRLSDLFNVFLSRLGVAPIHMHLCCKTTSVRHLHSHPHQQTWPCMTVSVLSCFLPSLPSHLILLSTRPPVLLSAKHSFSSPLQTCQPSCCIPLGLWLSLSFARRVVNFYKPICCTFAYW